jgi:hypothetical protein
LRNQFKDLKLVVAFLSKNESGNPDPAPSLEAADQTASSLTQAAEQIVSVVQREASHPVETVQPR